MAVLPDRRQNERLRLHLRLQIEHEAYHARLVATDAHRFDVWIVLGYAVRNLGQCSGDLDALEIEYKAFGVLDAEEIVRNCCVAFEREPGVISGGPYPRRGDRYALGMDGRGEGQDTDDRAH